MRRYAGKGIFKKKCEESWEKCPEVVCSNLFCFRRFGYIAWAQRMHNSWACALRENVVLLTFIHNVKKWRYLKYNSVMLFLKNEDY